MTSDGVFLLQRIKSLIVKYKKNTSSSGQVEHGFFSCVHQLSKQYDIRYFLFTLQ